MMVSWRRSWPLSDSSSFSEKPTRLSSLECGGSDFEPKSRELLYWFSVLFAAPEATARTATSIPSFFSDATLGNGQSSGFAVSCNPSSRTSVYMDARIGGSVRATENVPGTDYYTGSYLVLGRITFSDTAGQDRLEIWLDPSLSGDPGTPLFNVTGTWVDPGANNSF